MQHNATRNRIEFGRGPLRVAAHGRVLLANFRNIYLRYYDARMGYQREVERLLNIWRVATVAN